MNPHPGTPADADHAALRRIVEQVRAAHASGRAVEIRGGATKDFYGGPSEGDVLDTRPLRGIVDYEPSEMVITARGGTPVVELESALNEKGQALAFEPPCHGPASTIGGAVAAGLSGPARMRAGAIRDFVLGATLLNGRGELLRFGGQVMKNVAGYDISRSLAGSMGIFGVICEVSIKVPPLARSQATFACGTSLDGALELLRGWLHADLPLDASAWHADRLWVRLAGARAGVDAARRTMELAGCSEQAAPGDFWRSLRHQTHPFFQRQGSGADLPLWRVAVAPTRTLARLPGETLVEWHGALHWLRSAAPADQIRAAASQAGGHATRFRDSRRMADAFSPLPPALEQIHRDLKRAFDPAGIFNRGRMYDWL